MKVTNCRSKNILQLSSKKIIILPSATSIISRSPMAHNTTSLDKLNCSNFMDFDKCQDRFGWVIWPENDSNYLDVKLIVFKKKITKFRLVQKLTKGEADFNPIMGLRNQVATAAKNLVEKKLVSSCDTYNFQRNGWTTQTGSQGNWYSGPNAQKDFVTLLHYSVDKPESSYDQVWLLARKEKE